MAEAPNVEAEAEEPLNLSKLPEDTLGKVKKIPLHSTKSAKAVASIAGKLRRLVRKAVEAKAVVEPAVEKVVEAAPLAPVVEKAVEVVPAAKVVAPLVNIRQEMLEGENAVAAVRNLEHGLAAKGDIKSAPKAISKKKSLRRKTLYVGKSASDATVPIAVIEDIPSFIAGENNIADELEQLEKNHKECMEHCAELKKQITARKSAVRYDFELPRTAKLIDLLEKVILNPSKDWKQNMIQLIEIGHDVIDRLSGPSYFEAFFQIAFYLGIFPGLSEYTRNFFNKHGEKEDNFLYTKDINASGGKEQGISDITFELAKDASGAKDTLRYTCGETPSAPTTGNSKYFISVKRYTKEKSPKYYDIGELYTYISKKHPAEPFSLCICCRSKGEFLKRMEVSRSDYLTTSIDKLYGFDATKEGDGLLQVFERYRSQVFSNMAPSFSNDAAVFNVKAWITKHIPERITVKPALALYFHQELIVESVIKRIEDQKRESNKNNYICVGVLPRGGKSYIAGGIINRILEKQPAGKRLWVLFMTSAISETIGQFKEDLIENFSDFKDFDFIDLRKPKKGEVDYKTRLEKGSVKSHSFVFVSRELLTGKTKVSEKDEQVSIKQSNDKFRDIFRYLGYSGDEKVPFGLVLFDEAHKGGITDLTKAALYKHIEGSPPFVLMTATYKKLLDTTRGFIHIDKDLFIWDLDDIELMKKLPSLGLTLFRSGVEQDGEIRPFNLFNRYAPRLIEHILQRKLDIGETLESIAKPYENFPTPYFLSATFHPDIIAKLSGTGQGFDIQKHFALNLIDPEVRALLEDQTKSSEWYKAFTNQPQAFALRNYLTPHDSSDGVAIPESEKVLNRIFSITRQSMGIRARPSYGTPFSILMFLPTGEKDSRIGATCRAWGSLLLHGNNYWADNFIILGLSEFHLDSPPKSTVLPSVAEGGGSMYQLSIMRGGHGSNCLNKPLKSFCSEENINIDEKDLKSKIAALERAALEERKGLVILTGKRAAMGISLPCVDLVCLFDTDDEADMIIQKMYRALTDSPGKKYGFIFDFNLRRIFRAKFAYANTINFSQAGTRMSVSQMADHAFTSCLWDRDAWDAKVPSENFNDYMRKIKERLLGDIESEAYKVYEKDLDKIDAKVLDKEPIHADITAILKGAANVSSSKPGSERFQAPGKNAPPAPVSTSKKAEANEGEDEGEGEEAENEAAIPADELTETEIQNQRAMIIKLTKQFVNLLYIRDTDLFSNDSALSLSDFLSKYDADKEEAIKEKLLTVDACLNPTNNLYIRLVQDIHTLIPIPKLKEFAPGIPFVGRPSGDDIDERYARIPPMTDLEYTIYSADGSPHLYKAKYHPLAEHSINAWTQQLFKKEKKLGARKKSGSVSVFIAVKVPSAAGEVVPLGDFIATQPDVAEGADIPVNTEEIVRRTILVLEFIRNRFGKRSDKPNETLLNYTNYLEAFMTTLEKAPPAIQTGGKDSSQKRLNTILQVIEDHLVPDDIARTQRGEIFTPPTLVREMLFGLEGHHIFGLALDGINFDKDADESKRSGGLPKEVWRDPTLKWLDPANGIGNFPIIAFYKLDFMLKDIGRKTIDGRVVNFSDPDARRKHIIENMLYMIELDRGNNETAKGLFKKIHKSAKPNILCGNTLTMTYADIKKKFGVDKFDIIMGNPPFNPPKGETGSSGNSIWQHFVMKSFAMLNEGGYLVFVHPPGWKKPLSIKKQKGEGGDEEDEEEEDVDENESEDDGLKIVFDDAKFKDGVYLGKGKQIYGGIVWRYLKEKGVFHFIYTNDQKTTAVGNEFLQHFPAVDYYVYKKGGDRARCNTKNVFLGTVEQSKGVQLNYNLKYLPNLITKQTQDILHKITSKEGNKPEFNRFRKGKGFSVDSSKGKYKYIYTYNKKSEPKYQYSNILGDNINLDKVIMNFDGGIDCYTIQYVKKEEKLGSYEMSMYSKVESDKEGKCLEDFFKSDIVKFIFLITQYASGKRTKNERLVANSITIPPEGTADYYKFFGIEEHKKYIEEILAHYEKFKAPKGATKTVKAKAKGGSRNKLFNSTRKIRRRT